MELRENIGRRIAESRKALGLTVKQLSLLTGDLSPARIGNWEQGTRSPGPIESLQLAEHLNASAAYLLCLTDKPEGELHVGSEHGMRQVPLIDNTELINAKESLSKLDVGKTKYIVIDSNNHSLRSEGIYATHIDDSSMQPEYAEGDMIVVDAQRNPHPGDHVLAFIKQKNVVLCRRYAETEDGFQLIANNDLWANLTIRTEDEVDVIGVVVEHRRYL